MFCFTYGTGKIDSRSIEVILTSLHALTRINLLSRLILIWSWWYFDLLHKELIFSLKFIIQFYVYVYKYTPSSFIYKQKFLFQIYWIIMDQIYRYSMNLEIFFCLYMRSKGVNYYILLRACMRNRFSSS
jgi:hypothetical protein